MSRLAIGAADLAASPGLLSAGLLDGRGRWMDLRSAGIDAGAAEGGPLWLHLDITQPGVETLLDRVDGLSSYVKDALCLDETRPRSDQIDDGLLVILRGVNTNPGADPDDMVAIRIWLEPGLIISSRRRRLAAVQDLQQSLDSGRGPVDSGSFLVRMVDRLGFRAGEVVNQLEDEIDALEGGLSIDGHGVAALRNDLGHLRRQCAVLRRHLSPQRDALERLSRETSPVLNERRHLQLREETDQFRRLVEDLDLARERAMVAQEQLQSIVAEQQNQRMFVLSIVAAIFLPLGFVTGLLGMNVGGIPGTENPASFAWLLAGMAVAAVAIVGFFHWRRWL
ncbi:MAG: zinc transporter ZntB [Gammaproteobacteria bacterium]|jgi:zinc transporter|nr:zinc transporter ZntB [Gammaproteobacteria bacterium]